MDDCIFPLQHLLIVADADAVPIYLAASLQLSNEFNLFPSISNCMTFLFLFDIIPQLYRSHIKTPEKLLGPFLKNGHDFSLSNFEK